MNMQRKGRQRRKVRTGEKTTDGKIKGKQIRNGVKEMKEGKEGGSDEL